MASNETTTTIYNPWNENDTQKWVPLVNSSNGINLFDNYPSSLLYFAAACCIVFTILGVPGNLVTILALLKTPQLRNTTSVFIINLCVADTLFCGFTLPLTTSLFLDKVWTYGDNLCMIFPLLRYSNGAVSLFTVIAITVNRYVLIVHPNSYKRIYTNITIPIIIIAIWGVSFLLLTPTALQVWGKFAFNPDVSTCTIVPINGKSSKTFIYIMAFALPSVVFVFCYARIFWIVRKSEKSLRSGRGLKNKQKGSRWFNCFSINKEPGKTAEETKRKKKLSKDLKLLKVILVIFVAFIICYVPVSFVKIFKKEESLPVVNILGYLGVYFSGCINPIIYVVMSKEYRKAYINLFRCS